MNKYASNKNVNLVFSYFEMVKDLRDQFYTELKLLIYIHTYYLLFNILNEFKFILF